MTPENILVNDHGEILIIDFGLSAQVGKRQKYNEGKPPGTTAGTLFYMSERQLTGDTPKSNDDIYSLGLSLMQMLNRNASRGARTFARDFSYFKNGETAPGYAGPPNLGPKNRALAEAVYDYHDQSSERYREGIHKAIELSEEKFLIWFGERLRREISEGQGQKGTYDEVARRILSSPFLLDAYPTGLGFSRIEQKEIARAVERLRSETNHFYTENGEWKNLIVGVADKNPYLLFRNYDAKMMRGLWGLRLW